MITPIMSGKGDSDQGYGSIPRTEEAEIVQAIESSNWKKEFIAEVFGTCILVQIGCGSLCLAIYLQALKGMWQIAVIWTLGATLGILSTASISGGHLNPAVTLAFALVRRDDFSWKKVVPYWCAQLSGAMLAGLINLLLFHSAIRRYERKNGIARGDADSTLSAAAFGDYWSNSKSVDNAVHAFFIEAFATGFLTFVIFSMTHENNPLPSTAVPPAVGVAIGLMVALFGPLTGAGINPARDLGPRLITLVAGWGLVAMTNFGVYIVGPLVGGPVGAFLADRVLNAD